MLEDSKSENNSGAESKQSPDEEGTHPIEERPPSDVERGDLISYPGLRGLGFEAMLRSVLPSKKNLKRAGSRESEPWHKTRADT